jgi:CheY-like chemotaxis protein
MSEYRYCREYSHNKKSKLHILIVDDDVNSAELFKHIIEMRGHKVDVLNEGIRCISLIQENSYDVIFMDYHILDIDGVQLTDCIRDILKVESLIFAYTGDDSECAVNLFKSNGMNGAIIKPLDLNMINQVMTSIENGDSNKKNIVQKLIKLKSKSVICFTP